jgi:cobalt-zinc-cadmium resistance protein CzcA
MVRKLIQWAVNAPLIVLLLTVALVAIGTYSFLNVNVEAYPDPAPPIIEVVAQYPGASAEEVERQVTIPLEVALAGMPGLQYTRTKSLFGLCHMRNQFDYGVDYFKARQEVINRLGGVQNLPAGVSPQVSPYTPTGELMRYSLSSPRADGREIYSLYDLKGLEDYTLERTFKRIPRIADVSSFGGLVKRYEVRPDPKLLKKYGITLQQLSNAIANSNGNVGGDLLAQGNVALNVRGIGLIGGGLDPMQAPEVLGQEKEVLQALLDKDATLSDAERARLLDKWGGAKVVPPLTAEEQRRLRDFHKQADIAAATKAATFLRQEDERRLREIRQVVITSTNNVPVRVDDVVEGGPLRYPDEIGQQGVVVGAQTRLGKVSLSKPKRDDKGRVVVDADGKVVWDDREDIVQGIVLMRKYEETLPALQGVKDKLQELNDNPGRLLPGVQMEPHFDLTGLIHVTTETVRENLLMGMGLVIVILLMFLSNVRSALIVAINIPLALFFAFSVLFLRGKSANLLSIGAVDFGIIVDSSVIMVENIYRHLSAGEYRELPLKERILAASAEVEGALFFSAAIMVCAFIPLFFMQGPEGQIFGPMADTYAFALGGALLLSLTLAPVLCLLFFRKLKPTPDNFLVRWLKRRYLRQLEICLNHRWITLGLIGALIVGTFVFVAPRLGREFMPELEEGNLYNRGTFPVNIGLAEVSGQVRTARAIMRSFPEVELVASQVGRPDDGTDPSGFYNAEFSLPLKPEREWPAVKQRTGWARALFGAARPRTKPELVEEMSAELRTRLPGVDWGFSQYIRDNVTECLSGIKGDNSVKIIGPDLDKLEELAARVKGTLDRIEGMKEVGIFFIKGQPNLEIAVDRQKCSRWGVSVADVENAISTAVGGKAFTQMVEGEKTFDITLRWPEALRGDEQAILNIPVDITNNTVTPGVVPNLPQTPLTGASLGVATTGYAGVMPSATGSVYGANLNNISSAPTLRLRDLVVPIDEKGRPSPGGQFIRPGASTIYREQGNRLIAVKFSVRGRDLAGTVAEAREKVQPLIPAPYRTEWSGEFQEMQEAEGRLLFFIPLSLALIFVLLYLAFHSLLDVLLVLFNVVELSVGGVWALWLTGTNFSVSAGVGFISIFGVAVMDGLLLVSYFNSLRVRGLPLREAIMQGAATRIRPVTMTALTAIFGLLPAALSTRIGAQTQKPLAIVVVGAMVTTLFLTRYLMPVLYSFYGHRPPRDEGSRLAH